MIAYDMHVHSTFSDGSDTPERVVLSAIEKGLKCIGFSDHSYTSFDTRYCIQKENIQKYRDEISALKVKYADKIKILCGIEQDYFSDLPAIGYDYIIGSVHYIKVGEEYITVDDTPEIIKDAVNRHFGGDIYRFIDEYYRLVGEVAEKTKADIIGHFDLITKFNQNGEMFDETDERYIKASHTAVERLILSGKPFEINTGAISRGYRKTPYPSKQIRDYIRARGGKFLLSSDSHKAETLCCCFDKYEALL